FGIGKRLMGCASVTTWASYGCRLQIGTMMHPAATPALSKARSPYGHPIVYSTECRKTACLQQAGASDQGRELGAATADVIYAIHSSLAAAQAYYAAVKGRMTKYGREPDDLKDPAGVLSGFGTHARGSPGEVRSVAGVGRPAGRPCFALRRVW